MARTAKQRAALRKAQLASARKRRGKGKGKLAKANRKYSQKKRNDRIWRGVAVTTALVSIGFRTANYRRTNQRQKARMRVAGM